MFFIFTSLLLLSLSFVSSAPSSSILKECFEDSKVCNSLSLPNPKSLDDDFSRFKNICLGMDNLLYSDAFLDDYLGSTKTIYSLYSVCHEAYPECRLNGESCHCNSAMKNYFETQAYLSFVKCRQTTKLSRRKQQAEKFFDLSFDHTSVSEACNLDKFENSPWMNQYWSSIKSENIKKIILEQCLKSVEAKVKSNFVKKPELTGKKVDRPDSGCLRVGSTLKQFQFVGKLDEQKDKKSTLFGVGLVAYCGACECCESEFPPPSNQQRESFLAAAYNGEIDKLRRLYFENPLVLDSRDSDDDTALTAAAYFGKKKTVQFLIEELGMDVHGTGFRGRNCFLRAAERQNNIETLEYLSSVYPELVNGRDSVSSNALGLASTFADKITVQFLIEEVRMDPNQTGYGGHNCFLEAASGGRLETMNYLKSEYPDLVNQKVAGYVTALLLASRYANKATVEYLINEENFDVYSTFKQGRTCLMEAAEYGKLEIVKYLNENYPDLKTIRSDDGKTALDLAEAQNNEEIEAYLESLNFNWDF